MMTMVIDDNDDDDYLSTDVKWLDPSPWEESVKHNEQNVLAWWNMLWNKFLPQKYVFSL